MSALPNRCVVCGKAYKDRKNLHAHVREVHENITQYSCNLCSFTTNYKRNLPRHQKLHDRPTSSNAATEMEIDHPAPTTVYHPETTDQTALKRRLRIVTIPGEGADPEANLSNAKEQIETETRQELKTKTGTKLQVVMTVQFYKPLHPETCTTTYFRSNQVSIFRETDFDASYTFPKILTSINEYQKEGSGWVIAKVEKLEIYLAKLQPLKGSSYVKLPPYLRNKKAIVNVKNTDQKCFMWSVLALLYKANKDPQRVSKYRNYEKCLNLEGIQFPMKKNDVARFEKQNYLSINIYGFEDDCVIPLRVSEYSGRRWLHLLLYEGHFVAIRNLNRLLFDQTKHKEAKHFCPRCLIPKTTRQILQQHLELCKLTDPTKIVMPDDGVLQFTNIDRMLRQPLVIYGDFECLTTKSCEVTGKTEKLQKHVPCGYGFIESRNCCGEKRFGNPEVYCGSDATPKFLERVIDIAAEHQMTIDEAKAVVGKDDQRQKNDPCHICRKTIDNKRVVDHCHMCGRYRGPAHNKCNQGYRLNRDVVVVFHNLKKYDSHLLMQEIGAIADANDLKIEVVARSMEEYTSFSLVHPKGPDGSPGYKIKFIDSVQFLNNSLDGLVKNLDKAKMHATKENFTADKFELVTRKGVYPYDYMNSWDKFDTPLPSLNEFYNQLTGEGISEEDFQHACNVYDVFKMKSMRDYHNTYLKTDVLLLADVFEEFRLFALEKYGVDPCHYMTTPALGWDACLKMTKVELELLQDPDQYMFCEQGIRGGISQISHRYAEANNPYLPEYDSSRPNSYIIYLDANNLYGWAMNQKLPVRNFAWMTEGELAKDWNNIDTDGDEGYILEVDLEYPQSKHDEHDQYPLAPEPLEITSVSPYCENLKEKLGLKLPKQTKLVPNLHNKTKYILHFRNLQFYLEQGLKLTKVHRGLKFTQEAWMQKYIQFNTKMRAQATNAFEKDLFKLLNNAVFGKTMENVRKYKTIELVTNEERFEKLVANPRYKNCCRFNEGLVGVALARASTCLRKPIYCGQAVLDMSKELMYRFHYEYIWPKYVRRARLLFTDTDSLCYWIFTEDIYKDMLEDADRFDFSDYPTEHPCYSTTNKKVIGKMKDETAGVPVQKFCGLRPKMYALLPEKKRAKGISKRVVERDICFQDYEDVLFNESAMSHRMTVIASHKHEVFTEVITKKSLTSFEDKRWLLNSVDSRARGHYLNT